LRDSSAPIYTQYASPDLIAAIAYEGRDPGDDPNWPSSGAADQAEYATWCRHMCGVACLATALHHFTGTTPPTLFDLLAGCRKHGAYTVDDEGQIHGLIYTPFAEYVRTEHGLDTVVHRELPVDELLAHLDADRVVLVSVNKEIRRPDLPAPGKGGHLVLATSHAAGAIRFRNPSGHTPQSRAAVLPIRHFDDFYAQRGVSIGRSGNQHP
jgi:hypothetical protein